METPTGEPAGPRGPRTTPPHGDPLKHDSDRERNGSGKPRKPPGEEPGTSGPQPEDDPQRRDIPR